MSQLHFTLEQIREAREEVGAKIKLNDLGTPLIINHHDKRGERLYVFFYVKKWTGIIENKESDKCTKIEWFNKKKLPTTLIKHIKFALINIQMNKTYLELGF